MTFLVKKIKDLAPLNRMYIRDSHAVMVIYDVTSVDSLRAAERWKRWIEVIKEAAPSEVVMVLAGNKMETPTDRHQVSLSDAMSVARANNVYAPRKQCPSLLGSKRYHQRRYE